MKVVGIIGLVLHGTLWSITSWRLVHHFESILCRRHHSTDDNSDRRQERNFVVVLWTPRRIFHSLLWIATTVESLAYADFAGLWDLSNDPKRSTIIGYVLLEVVGRSTFEFFAFSVVTALWFITAMNARVRPPPPPPPPPSATTTTTTTTMTMTTATMTSRVATFLGDSFPLLLIGWGCLLLVVSILQAVDMIIRMPHDDDITENDDDDHDDDDDDDEPSPRSSAWIYRLHLLVEGLSWGFHAALSVFCVVLTAARILSLSTWPQSGLVTRTQIMTKALLPMALCSLCYAVRAVWLLVRLSRLPASPPVDAASWCWWIVLVWIPTLIPSALLLYSARKRDAGSPEEFYGGGRGGGAGAGGGLGGGAGRGMAAPLLPTPIPPAEAFISFRRFSRHHQQDDLSAPYTRLQNGSDDDNDDNDEGEDDDDDDDEQEDIPRDGDNDNEELAEAGSRDASRGDNVP